MEASVVIARAKDRATMLASDFRAARNTRKVEKEALAVVQQELDDTLEAQRIVQAVAQSLQQKAHHQIAGLVSRCLAAVFDKPYQFKIHFESKRGKTEARFVFARGGREVDPLTASGGGCVDVAAFALRLSALLLSRPPVRRVLVLDEPFRFVSKKYRHPLRTLLEQLAKELKVQFLIVTHIDELTIGTIIELDEPEGIQKPTLLIPIE